MQVLKEEVREKILEAAIDTFYEHGYKDTSIRKLAQKAGTTPGNIYAYFKSKQELFKAVLSQIVSLLNETIKTFYIDKNPQELSIEMLTNEITSIFLAHDKAFMILMSGSEGTDYEHYRSGFCDLIAERLLRDFPVVSKGNEMPNDLSLHAFSHALIEGVFYIFRQYDGTNEADIRVGLHQLMAFLFHNMREQL